MRLSPFLLLLSSAAPAGAQVLGQDWSPSDRAVIGDFTHITSVAAASDRVYATSSTALIVWNPMFRTFDGPYLPPDPDMLRRVFVGLVDPLDNSLWLGRLDGWVHYDPFARRWEQGDTPAAVQEIAFDLDKPLAGLYLRTSAGWMVVPRGGLAATPSSAPARPLRPPTAQEAVNANPTLLANSAQILMGRTLASGSFTCAARSFDGLGWYLGTWGVGLLFLPDGAALPQRLTFGLPGASVGAVFGAPGGVWVATDRTPSTPAGLAFLSSDLTEVKWLEGTVGFGLPFGRVLHIVGVDTMLWAATDGGLARINPETGDVQLYDQGRGLPDSRVYTVTTRRGLVVAGTAHGIVRIQPDGAIERLAPAFVDAAYALAFSRSTDTLWVGTPMGLRVLLAGDSNLAVLDELRTMTALGEPIIALGWSADTLVGITEDRLVWRDPAMHSWWLGPTLTPLLGRLRAFAVDQGGVWIAGERAVGFARFNAMPIRSLAAPGDLPAEPAELAIDDEYLWVGTADGIVRFRLDAIRP